VATTKKDGFKAEEELLGKGNENRRKQRQDSVRKQKGRCT
jgi:hypothetical protein